MADFIRSVCAYIRQQINAPQLSAQAAAAPAAALGTVAQAIAGVGEHFQSIADQTQKLENARMESEARHKLATSYADLQNELATENDPAAIVEKTRGFFAQSRNLADNPDLPPAVRETLLAHYSDFETKGIIDAGGKAATLAHKRAGLALQNELQSAYDQKNPDAVRDVLSRSVEAGVLTPEEQAEKQREADLKFQADQIQSAIHADPLNWLKNNSPDNPPPGFDQSTWRRYFDYGDSILLEQSKKYADTAALAIVSGNVTTKEGIDDIALGKARPDTLLSLYSMLETKQKQAALAATSAQREEKKRLMNDPEHQNKVIGEIESMLDTYEYAPDADSVDMAMVNMQELAEQLPPGPLREGMRNRIQRIYDGQVKEVKTVADQARRGLQQYYRDGGFGDWKDPEKPKVMTFIDQGFLNNPKDLAEVGLSPAQIASLDEPVKVGKNSRPPSTNDRIERFRKLWTQRDQGMSAKADSFKLRVASAIAERQETLPLSKEQEDTLKSTKQNAWRNYGKALRQLDDFLKTKPKPSEDELRKVIFSLGGEGAVNDFGSQALDPEPADPTVPNLPVRKPNDPVDLDDPILLPTIPENQ